MRVALIAPPYPLEETPSPPLGICYAAAAFETAGATVKIFDYIVRKYSDEKLKREIDEFRPDIIGANSVTMNFNAAASILRVAKQYDPSLVTLMGGPHVTFDVDKTFRDYPQIDLVVVGEGDITIKELVPVIHNKAEWKQIKGLAFPEKGKVVKTGAREFVQDLDSLPLPARHLLPVSRYQALGFPVTIITSRGCPNQCIFCQGRKMAGMKVRYRSPELVVDEIEHLLSYGFNRINIADDFFTSNQKRVRLVCDEIMKRGIKFTWTAFAKVNSVDKDLLRTMLEAGCDTISFGIESGNPDMLKRVKKRITLDQARKAVQDCKDTGMAVLLSFMVGLPGETKETMNDSLELAEELGVAHGYHFLAPFPGTTLMDDIDTYDLELLTDDYDQFDANRAIVKTSGLTPGDMEDFVQKYIERCDQDDREVAERYLSGKGDFYDQMKYEGNKRLGLMFRLLSEDIIEDNAFYPKGDGAKDPVETLCEVISGVMDIPHDDISSLLKDMVAPGYLKYEIVRDHFKWYWTHNKDMDKQVFV